MDKVSKIQVRQNGQVLSRFAGWRLHRTGMVSGIVGRVVCYSDMVFGNPRDPRSGQRVTPADFGGAVSVEVFDCEGNMVARYGLASREHVANHPNCKAVAWE